MVVQAKPDKLIDVDKLREIGVPESVIDTLDERDGGNITPDGEVLYLNEDRMHRREHPEQPLHKNHSNGLGIKNFLCQHVIHARPSIWGFVLQEFKLIVAGAYLTGRTGPIAGLYKRITQFSPDEKMYSHGTVMQLNVDLTEDERAKSTILPIDLIDQAIDNAEFIGIMNHCICRSAYKCETFNPDIGCLFLNMAGVTAVNNGLAHEATKEEAHAHVRKAMEAGLTGQALYVELEQLIWGFRNDKMDEFCEICFCCPCCCVALKFAKNGSREIKNRFLGTGFTAVINHDKCTGCGKCAEACPQEIITYREDGKACIDQEHCIGCGFCKRACSSDAITIKQTMPMRESIHEYFLEEGRLDWVMDRCTMELKDKAKKKQKEN